ncbi:hypothetical protein SMF1_0016 [Sulfolobales Mexican fusellovirus 1]|nr:hypothetical protein SMF1_0016 [Sulfolobales Mexican fusellovirus 1]AGG36563.1 hypothetical protein SMF1_0016 [Sulfolobales Mexican fusellovirus 1]
MNLVELGFYTIIALIMLGVLGVISVVLVTHEYYKAEEKKRGRGGES